MDLLPSYEASEVAATSGGNGSPYQPSLAPPYDEEEYLDRLDETERERVQDLNRAAGRRDSRRASTLTSNSTGSPEITRPSGSRSVGSKLMDRLTKTTHEQRAEKRRSIADQERKSCQMHDAMMRAWKTGQPEFARRDENGKDIYALPPGDNIIKDGPGAKHEAWGNPNAVFVKPKSLTPNANKNGYAGPYSRPMNYGGGAALGAVGFS